MLAVRLAIMRKILIAGGHTASNAPDLFRPPKLSAQGPVSTGVGDRPGRPQGAASLFLFASSVPVCESCETLCGLLVYFMLHVLKVLFWLLLRLWTVSACLFVVVWVFCFLRRAPEQHLRVPIYIEQPHSQLACSTTSQSCVKASSLAGGHTASNALDLFRPPK